ncbi:MAG: hypothetical protein OXD40_06120 [bacterium]|nr:hypothetical protein [bacterium]
MDTDAANLATGDFIPLLVAESILLIIVLVVLPAYAAWRARTRNDVPLKGLALPQGSVRSMLALAVVGSFVVFLVFGARALPHEGSRFTEIVAALTGIAGTVVGFYFGGNGSGRNDQNESTTPTSG